MGHRVIYYPFMPYSSGTKKKKKKKKKTLSFASRLDHMYTVFLLRVLGAVNKHSSRNVGIFCLVLESVNILQIEKRCANYA